MYNHQGTVTLETDRLILRRFKLGDAEAMFNTWTNDEEVVKYMRWDTHKSAQESEDVLSDWVINYEKADYYHWGITIKATNELIGSIGMFCVNAVDMCYEAGYCIGRAYWNKGYTTEALSAIIKFGLLNVGINRIEAYHSIFNPASGQVMQKCGMKYEGRLRQKYKSNRGFEDADLYAVVRGDLDV